MHKHLKAELVPPDHVNPKLSAGISEVIEMMMAKDPRKRYQNTKDLLSDLRQVRKGETPTIAHKDILGTDLAGLVQAEAQAQGEIAVDTSRGPMQVRTWLLYLLAGMLALSLTFNIVLYVTRGGG
jgi:serine/threonine-protein kinase